MATTTIAPVDHDDPLERPRPTAGRTASPAAAPTLQPVVLEPAAVVPPAARARAVPRTRVTPPVRPVRRGPVPPVDRTPGELDRARRDALADRLHALVEEAVHVRRRDTAPRCAHRTQVLEAQGRLADLEHALRSGIPLLRRGERLVARLVADDAIGAHAHGDPRALHDAADAACAALGLRTPFH